MIKRNKYLWLFSGIFFVLGTLLYNACVKYIPFFLHNTVYYCRQLIQSVSLQPLQLNLKSIALWGIAVLGLYIVTKTFLTVLQIISQYRALQQKATGNKDISVVVKRLNLDGKVHVIQDKRIGAFCFGFTSPKIYISTQMLAMATSEEIEAVLRHEKYHLENNDTLVMLFAVFIESFFPFFPLLSDLISLYHTHREIQADRSAFAAMDKGKDHLRSILTKLLSQNVYPAYIAAPSFVDTRTLETRIRILIQESSIRSKLSVKNVVVSALSVMILGALAVAPVRAIEYHHYGVDAIVACINSNGSCTNACQQNNIPVERSSQSSRLYSPVTFTSLSY